MRLERRHGTALSNVPRRITYHSLNGFEWGYGGSGPAYLALNVLYCFLDFSTAWQPHQEFKADFIEGLPPEGAVIPAERIRAWIDRKLAGFQDWGGKA